MKKHLILIFITLIYQLSYSQELAKFKENGKYGLKDKYSGKLIAQPKYGNIGGLFNSNKNLVNFEEGPVMVYLNNVRKQGYINEKGRITIPMIYEVAHDFSAGLAAVRKNEKWGFINEKGNTILPFEYESVSIYGFKEGLVAVEKKSSKLDYFNMFTKYGFINKNGETIIPFKYDFASSPENGLAEVKLDDKWGYIDKRGKVVVSIIYDEIDDFGERYSGYARAKLNNTTYYVDRNNNRLSKKEMIEKIEKKRREIEIEKAAKEFHRSIEKSNKDWFKKDRIVSNVKWKSKYLNKVLEINDYDYDKSRSHIESFSEYLDTRGYAYSLYISGVSGRRSYTVEFEINCLICGGGSIRYDAYKETFRLE